MGVAVSSRSRQVRMVVTFCDSLEQAIIVITSIVSCYGYYFYSMRIIVLLY